MYIQPSDRIKQSLDIWEAAQRIDCPLPKPQIGRPTCPFCQSNSGFSVKDDKYFNCYRCGRNGTVIDLTMAWLDCGFTEAVRKLKPNLEAPPPLETGSKLDEIFATYQTAFAQSKEAQDYAKERGWTSYPIGYAPSSYYLREYGKFAKKELAEYNLLNRAGAEFFDRRLIFPIKDTFGRICHFQGRSIDVHAKLKWLSTAGGDYSINRFLFNGEQLRKDYQDYSYIFICEGISDTLSLLELGLPAVGILGNNMPLDSYRSLLNQFDDICFCLDNDRYEKGTEREGRYKSWSRMLPEIINLQNQIGSAVYCLTPPSLSGVSDLNEYLIRIEFDQDEFWRYLNRHIKLVDQMAVETFDGSQPEDFYWLVRSQRSPYAQPGPRETVKRRIETHYFDWLEFAKEAL